MGIVIVDGNASLKRYQKGAGVHKHDVTSVNVKSPPESTDANGNAVAVSFNNKDAPGAVRSDNIGQSQNAAMKSLQVTDSHARIAGIARNGWVSKGD